MIRRTVARRTMMEQTAANLISQLVMGQVVQPGEPWIREYLGIPAASAEAE